MASTPTTSLSPSRPTWPTRRLQDWLEQRGQHQFDWPDWPDWWPEAFDSARLKIEEFQDDAELVVRAELPGIDPEKDVEITVADHTLRVRAERRKETKTEDKQGYRSEFSYGSYTRTLPLPAGATDTDVKASYNDGILEVRVPIDTEQAEATKIPISRG
ncbi:MAG: Hsp20/alpha crystallin family protein [Actinomycetia bacterium]|nr:Hsp20/alpha crystallin family protein [Actinomycetes bacterium]